MERDDLVMMVIIGAAVLLIFGLAWFLVVRPLTQDAGGEAGAVYAVAEEFVNALSDGDPDRAWGQMTPAYRSAVSAARFRSAVAGHAHLAALRGARMGEYVRRGDAATLTGTLDSAGGRLPAELHLARRDGRWYMVEVIVAGRPALPSASGG